jgi:hypothetical protein
MFIVEWIGPDDQGPQSFHPTGSNEDIAREYFGLEAIGTELELVKYSIPKVPSHQN